jgi:hypothetical protein
MTLSGDDITDVLKDVSSAPPVAGTVRAAAADLLPFTPSKPSVDEIFAKLADMTLPPPILEKAQLRFGKDGFAVEIKSTDFQGDQPRPYTAAFRGENHLALMHVPPQLFEDIRTWIFLGEVIENVKGSVRFMAQNCADSSPGFNGYLRTRRKRGKDWHFVSWNFVAAYLEEHAPIEQVFEIDLAPLPAANDDAAILNLGRADESTVLDSLIFLADNYGPGKRAFFENLVDGAGWPDAFKGNIAGVWTGNPTNDATRLLKYLVEQNRIPAGDENAGDTYLGQIFRTRMMALGNPRRRNVALVILNHGLLTRAGDLEEIRKFAGRA